jgi:cytochrome c biogenesis protein
MTASKKIYELLSSMRFAVSVLTVLGIASIIGTVLKQNEPYANYIIQFGQFWFDFFEVMELYDVYHSAWFLVILVFLVVSTSLCIYRNTPLMLKELKAYRENATEKSLHAFSHQHEYSFKKNLSGQNLAETKQALAHFLTVRGFRFKTVQHADGSELIAAKAGSYQRLGYIFTHLAIVIICIGGLMDGNVPLKVQELLGQKKVEVRDIPANEVPKISRLSVKNLSFRANMTLPEGATADVAFQRVRDGYMVQELPFGIGLTDFRIEHYPTGQPKSFESDLVIYDPELKAPFKRTISVNHPLIYKGIAIYQSDFQDGGSALEFNAWNILGSEPKPTSIAGAVFKKVPFGQNSVEYQLEFNDFRKFNILNLSPDGKGKPHNVGANATFKVRDAAGQANEYVNYMQPLQLDGKYYFVSGMRSSPQEEFKYLRIPADANLQLQGFMQLKSVLFDKSLHAQIAHRFTAKALNSDTSDAATRAKFDASVVQLLGVFADGGYAAVAKMIETSVPQDQREKAAQTYIKIMTSAAFEAYQLAQERAGIKSAKVDEGSTAFLQDSLNAMSDLFYYGAPVYLELTKFEQREASGLQLTRSPGKNLVYIGSVLLVLGIFAMIYIRERRIWLLIKPKSKTILFAMSANRKNRDFEIEFNRHQSQLKALLES